MKVPKIGHFFNHFVFLKKTIKNKKILIGIVVILCFVIAFYVYNAHRSKTGKSVTILAEVHAAKGVLDPGDEVTVSLVASRTSAYTEAETAASFVGNLYKIAWKSGLKTMTRAPVEVWIPIPSKYYFGDDSSNLNAIEIVNGMPYPFYGGQIRTKNGIRYLEVLTYFPGIVGITLKQNDSNYGFKLIRKVSDNSPNLVIIPGSNINFAGNISGIDQNVWAQNFPNCNVYVFSYLLTSTRSLSYTAKIINYFQKTGVDSYTQYIGKTIADLLATLKGKTYIIAQGIGGLIARYAVQSNSELKGVKKVVLFDTPNSGTSFASPYMLSNLYNAGGDFVSRKFSLKSETFEYAINISTSYLRLLNFFAKDISLNSAFLSRLNDTPKPTATVFLSIVGTKPNIPIHSEEMKSYFPQLIDGEGDGIVPVKSALYFGDIKLKFPYSFYDIFTHQDVQKALKKFINSEVTSSKTIFKPDVFVEKKSSSNSTVNTRVSTPTIPTTTLRSYKYLSDGDYLIKPASNGKYFSQYYSVFVPQTEKVLAGSEGIYLLSNNSVYFLSFGGHQLVYNGRIEFSNTYDDHLYIVTNSMQVLEFTGSVSRLKCKLPFDDYQSVFVTDRNIYALENGATSTLLKNVGNKETLLKIPGKHSIMRYIPSDKSFIIVSDSYVAVYSVKNHVGVFFEKMEEIIKKAGFKSDQSLPIKSAYMKDNLIYLLSSNYVLLAVDMKTHGVQVIGNADIGNLKLILYKNLLVVVGVRTLNIYDTLNRIKVPVYQRISKTVDAIVWNGTIFLLHDKGGRYELERYKRIQ